jgi:hypothetical protein
MIYQFNTKVITNRSIVIGISISIFSILTTFNSVAIYAQNTTEESCDASLWDHVYHPARLQILKSCTSVTGVIDHIKTEPDGDLHIRVHLDPQFSSLTNSVNDQLQAGDLVIEPVCDHEPTKSAAATESCSGFQNQILIPPEGTHVQITGVYVLDTKHGWTEIHPVSDITDLDSSRSLLSTGILTTQPSQKHAVPPERQHVAQDDIPDD